MALPHDEMLVAFRNCCLCRAHRPLEADGAAAAQHHVSEDGRAVDDGQQARCGRRDGRRRRPGRHVVELVAGYGKGEDEREPSARLRVASALPLFLLDAYGCNTQRASIEERLALMRAALPPHVKATEHCSAIWHLPSTSCTAVCYARHLA